MKKIIFLLSIALILPIVLFFKTDTDSSEIKAKYLYPESKFITIDGTNVHYRKTGQGPVVLLMHGVTSSLHTWEHWQKVLSKDFTVITLDVPAFGLTGPMGNDDYTLVNYISFLNKFRIALKIDKMSIVGNSFGGLLASNYTLNYPEVIEKLIICDAPSDNPDLPIWMKFYQIPIIKNFARYITPKLAVEYSVKDVYKDDTKITESTVNRYYDMMTSNKVRENFSKVLNMQFNVNNPKLKTLKNIQVPTLIMWGDSDIIFPISVAEQYHSLIKNSELKVYSAGHIPMEENPEETVKDALEFLKRK